MINLFFVMNANSIRVKYTTDLSFEKSIVKEADLSINIVYISPYIATFHKTYPTISVPITLCDDQILRIFIIWFSDLERTFLDIIDKNNMIFKPSMFRNFDLIMLTKLYNFGFINQIPMFYRTIAYIIKDAHIFKHGEMYHLSCPITSDPFFVSINIPREMVDVIKECKMYNPENSVRELETNFPHDFIKEIYDIWYKEGFKICENKDFKKFKLFDINFINRFKNVGIEIDCTKKTSIHIEPYNKNILKIAFKAYHVSFYINGTFKLFYDIVSSKINDDPVLFEKMFEFISVYHTKINKPKKLLEINYDETIKLTMCSSDSIKPTESFIYVKPGITLTNIYEFLLSNRIESNPILNGENTIYEIIIKSTKPINEITDLIKTFIN